MLHSDVSAGRSRRRRVRALAVAAGVAGLVLPAAAAADSIVYLDGGNVWSASPDGAHRVQLTDGGDWHSPTQADDGTIAAVEGTGPIVVMARDGRPLHTITTPEARTGNGGLFAPRPVDLSFSPDGSKLAYSYVQGSCPPASSCTIQRSTFYTEAGVSEATPVATYGNQFGVGEPEWVTNARTLVFGGAGSQVSIDDLGPGDYSHTAWLTPNTDMGDGEVSRDGTRLAATFDYGANTLLAFFAVKGDARSELPPAQPDPACTTSAPDARFGDPSWAPDSAGLAYESSSGIEITHFTELSADHCVTTGDAVLTATGSAPDWGPADPPAARFVAAGGGAGDGGGGAGGGSGAGGSGGGGGGGAAGPAVTVRTGAKVRRAALRQGLRVELDVAGAGAVRVKLRAGKRVVAKGAARATAAGRVTVRLSKVPRAKAAKLRTLRLAVTLTPAGGSPATVSKSVRVR